MSSSGANASATSTVRLPERKIAFEYPDDLNLAWNHQFPEFACAANSVSLIMPFAEPYFVKSVRSALPLIEDDPALTAQTQDYLKQELQHHVQHRKFNLIVERQYPKISRIENWMRQTYGWLGRTRSQKFNVAFAAGSEAIAYSIARWSERHLSDLFDDADPVASTLFLWHLAEEVEHKSAAFDVYERIDGSRLRYAIAGTMSLVIFAFFVWIATLSMLRASGRLWYPITHFRLCKWAVSIAFVLLPTVTTSALPHHHPSTFADPVFLPKWLQQYDPDTGTMPLWPGTRVTL